MLVTITYDNISTTNISKYTTTTTSIFKYLGCQLGPVDGDHTFGDEDTTDAQKNVDTNYLDYISIDDDDDDDNIKSSIDMTTTSTNGLSKLDKVDFCQHA